MRTINPNLHHQTHAPITLRLRRAPNNPCARHDQPDRQIWPRHASSSLTMNSSNVHSMPDESPASTPCCLSGSPVQQLSLREHRSRACEGARRQVASGRRSAGTIPCRARASRPAREDVQRIRVPITPAKTARRFADCRRRVPRAALQTPGADRARSASRLKSPLRHSERAAAPRVFQTIWPRALVSTSIAVIVPRRCSPSNLWTTKIRRCIFF